MTSRTLGLLLLGAIVPGAAVAQTAPPAVTTAPLNVLVPNYNNVAVGEIGSLEANAFVAPSRRDVVIQAILRHTNVSVTRAASIKNGAVDPQSLAACNHHASGPGDAKSRTAVKQ